MKFTKLTKERVDLITRLSGGAIDFKQIDGTIKGVKFQSPIGPIYVEIDSYSISVNELAKETSFYLGFQTDVADDKIFIEKHFASESDREEYIAQYLSTIPRDELTIENREVESN